MSGWQTVDVVIEVSVPDDAGEDEAVAIVKAALEADERIEYVELNRTSVLIER